MVDPTLELQAAIVAALKADAAVKALVGASKQRVYDDVPPEAKRIADTGASMPYINLGPPQVLPDAADCIDGAAVSYTIHGWAAGPQSVAIKQLGKAIAGALDGNELTLTGHRTVLCELEQTQYLDDPDGLTKHVAVTIRVLTEPT